MKMVTILYASWLIPQLSQGFMTLSMLENFDTSDHSITKVRQAVLAVISIRTMLECNKPQTRIMLI